MGNETNGGSREDRAWVLEDAKRAIENRLTGIWSWLESIADQDWSEIVADGGITAGMVIQQEARGQRDKVQSVIEQVQRFPAIRPAFADEAASQPRDGEVIQSDREAGLSLHLYTRSLRAGDYRYDSTRADYLEGRRDDWEMVKAFARHRLATQRPAEQPREGEVGVIQADRNFAADYSLALGKITDRDHAAICQGLWDGTYYVTQVARYRHSLATQRSAEQADDVVMIPREPTEAMMDAGLYQSSHDSQWADVNATWKAMFDAVALDGGTSTSLPAEQAGVVPDGLTREAIAKALHDTARKYDDLEPFAPPFLNEFADAVLALAASPRPPATDQAGEVAKIEAECARLLAAYLRKEIGRCMHQAEHWAENGKPLAVHHRLMMADDYFQILCLMERDPAKGWKLPFDEIRDDLKRPNIKPDGAYPPNRELYRYRDPAFVVAALATPPADAGIVGEGRDRG